MLSAMMKAVALKMDSVDALTNQGETYRDALKRSGLTLEEVQIYLTFETLKKLDAIEEQIMIRSAEYFAKRTKAVEESLLKKLDVLTTTENADEGAGLEGGREH